MTDRDPITLAREVVRQHGHLDRDALSRREKERLDLALAVHDLVSKVKRVEALAMESKQHGEEEPSAGATYGAFADALTTALNGDNA